MTSLLKDTAAGGFGGVCASFVGQPLDTIKTRMQTERAGASGVLSCGSRIVSEEGLYALYRGLFPVLMGVVPIWGLSFLGYSLGKEVWCSSPERQFILQDEGLQTAQTALAGASAALFVSPIVTPVDRIKCIQQCDNTGYLSSSFIGTVRHVWSQGGFRSLYMGLLITLARNTVSFTVYFSSFEYLKKTLKGVLEVNQNYAGNGIADKVAASKRVSTVSTVVAGGCAGTLSWICLPLDTLKSRLQVASIGKFSGAVLGPNSVLEGILRIEGIPGLYKVSSHTRHHLRVQQLVNSSDK
jgi:solute carrier family 25 carnitine/acylcarnitine transporter 20/29